MKCQICKDKEFSLVIESHKPIEDQPIIICYQCMKKIAYDLIGYDSDLAYKISQVHQELKGKRCIK